MKTKFPRTLAAVQRREKSLWEIGDALIAECGPPGEAGVQDGSRAKIVACAAELIGHGYEDYTDRYLAMLREVAHKFRPKDRQISLPWMAHRCAQTPEALKAIITGAKGKRITGEYVMLARRGLLEAEKHRRRAAAEAAREEREAAQERARRATDDRARRRAEADADAARKREEEYKQPPKRGVLPAPSPEETSTLVASARLAAECGGIKRALKQIEKDITPYVDDLSQAVIAAGVDDLLEIANTARDLADLLRKHQTNKRSHLRAVNE